MVILFTEISYSKIQEWNNIWIPTQSLATRFTFSPEKTKCVTLFPVKKSNAPNAAF